MKGQNWSNINNNFGMKSRGFSLTLFHSEGPKLYDRVLAVPSAIGLTKHISV